MVILCVVGLQNFYKPFTLHTLQKQKMEVVFKRKLKLNRKKKT